VHLDLWISLAGFIVGVVVGLTGMGGGALMTPMLVIFFGIQPLAAVSSDLVAAVVMKPIGGGIHLHRGTVHAGLVRWLALGSVPGALLGSYLISHLGGDVSDEIQVILGVVLLVAAAAMVVRSLISARRGVEGVDGEAAARIPVRHAVTFAVGIVGGVIVGMTSVGSGSLMIVAMMLLYPMLSTRELVGTDLVQAIPLVLAAAIGHLIWGDFQLALTGSLLLGAVPGVVLGAQISSRASDTWIRPVLVLVLTLSALKLLNVSNAVLLSVAVAGVVGAVGVLAVRRRRGASAPVPEPPARSGAPAAPLSSPG
jgi:uncharacterized membrane protein YfcA